MEQKSRSLKGNLYLPLSLSLSQTRSYIHTKTKSHDALYSDRYAKWLDKLYDVSFRQTMAYGGWSLSLNYLYHSTQVIAVLIGGISIMAGKLTAEQLTKFILYAEWLILSTWWIGDNWSSLMQSVGASEKVFRLMDLLPSRQLSSEGHRLQKLEGRIQYADVSFSYPSRPTV
jgi:ABC-type multidrug transport system fused ATPase/permease subunit